MTPREKLLTMLTYRRPASSKAERRFINRFIVPTGAKPDGAGNYILRVGTAPIMWSSHTDTVHASGGRQTVKIREGIASVPHQDCLGADCTVGVWLMLEMIQAGVEGLYIFHREEECGRVGANWLVSHTPEVVKGIQAAIAFDRYGYTSIITHQMGKRCASEAFSASLADALSWNRLHDWKSDDGGSYTDTASYTKLIPECTNISVGYDNQHSSWETQDVDFAMLLRETLIEADFTQLAIKRDPTAAEEYSMRYWRHSFQDGAGAYNEDLGEDHSWIHNVSSNLHSTVNDKPVSQGNSYDTLLWMVKKYPEAVASFLDDNGVSPWEVLKDAC